MHFSLLIINLRIAFLLFSWPHRNQFHSGVKDKKVLFVPCRIYFYYIVLHCIKRWERRKWVFLFSSVNCRSPRVGYFSSPGLVEDLALTVLIPPVHEMCSFYWRESEHLAQSHFYCVCTQLWLFLYSENSYCHEDMIRSLHFTAHARKAEISTGAFIIMYFRRGKMNCWGGERLDTSNAKN